MRIFQYDDKGARALGVAVSEREFVPLKAAAADLPGDLIALMKMPDGLKRAETAANASVARQSFDGITYLPLLSAPNALWALALNFKRHIEETGLTTSREYPHMFMRHARSFVGHMQPLVCPPPSVARAYDYEGELMVLIGKPGRHIPLDKAMDHVAGFTVCNEGSIREYQSQNRQFGLGKNFEKSGSYGPFLVTLDEVPNYQQSELVTRLNGVVRQRTPMSDLLFNVEQTIAYLSKGTHLQPGDAICMGTPGALPPAPGDVEGADLSKQYGPIKVPGLVHMKPGDTVEVEITGVGILRNPVIADQPDAYRAG